VDGVLRLTSVEFAALFDGIDWVRRITDGRQRVMIGPHRVVRDEC
jgi:hypothetical protein